MRSFNGIHFTLIALVALGMASLARSSQEAQPAAQPQQSMEEMTRMAQQMAAPGEQHKLLGRLVGEWKQTGKFIMPGQSPIEFSGKTSNRMILGDRFLQLDGTFVAANPALKGESMTVYGFDKRVGKYTAWGIDTWGTYSVAATGDYDAATRTWTLSGENAEGGMTVPFKFILKQPDDTHYTLELHMQYPGMGWQKQMETVHEKVK